MLLSLSNESLLPSCSHPAALQRLLLLRSLHFLPPALGRKELQKGLWIDLISFVCYSFLLCGVNSDSFPTPGFSCLLHRRPSARSLLLLQEKGRGKAWRTVRPVHAVTPGSRVCMNSFPPILRNPDISSVELSVAWNGISPLGGMGEEWRPVWPFQLVEPTDTLFLYMFFVSLFFFSLSLNMCLWTGLLWTCDVLPLRIKPTKNPPLTWASWLGFLFHFVRLLCPPPLSTPDSLSLTSPNSLPACLSLFVSLSFSLAPSLTGVPEDAHGKKFKAVEDAAGLVPYGGDSSDEEEERTHSSKTSHS